MRCAPFCVILVGLGLSGCGLAPVTPTAKLAEAAYDLNEAARFGRMDVALEHVKDTVREDFSRKHARWGKAVRIVDYEVASVVVRKDGDADVTLTINWQRPDETSMRSTELSQRWSSPRGTWWLMTEEERGGDPGLLGLVPAMPAPPSDANAAAAPGADGQTAGAAPPAVKSRYQTRVIYEQ